MRLFVGVVVLASILVFLTWVWLDEGNDRTCTSCDGSGRCEVFDCANDHACIYCKGTGVF